MKCEHCLWSVKPDLITAVRDHIEQYHMDIDCQVIWKKGEFVIAVKPTKKEKESLIDVGVRKFEKLVTRVEVPEADQVIIIDENVELAPEFDPETEEPKTA